MKTRLYSLYAITYTASGRKCYDRISELAFSKPVAVRVFQNSLLAGALGGGQLCCLRPIPREKEVAA